MKLKSLRDVYDFEIEMIGPVYKGTIIELNNVSY